MNTLNTTQFFWDSENKVFSQEVSTLRTIDTTFRLVDESEFFDCVMNLGLVRKDNEGDILDWTFFPESRDLQFKVVIFND